MKSCTLCIATWLVVLAGCSTMSSRMPSSAPPPPWVAESDRFFDDFVRARAAFQPSVGSANGMREFDAKADALIDDTETREIELAQAWQKKAEALWAKSEQPELRTDLKVFTHYADQLIMRQQLDRKLGRIAMPPGTRRIMQAIQQLTSDQALPAQKQAAPLRFHEAVNGHDGFQPYLKALKSRVLYLEAHAPGKKPIWPTRFEVENYLNQSQTYLAQIKDALVSSRTTGWELDFEVFTKQAREYDAWVKSYVLPKARKSHRVPLELYQSQLLEQGIDAKPMDLIKLARGEWQKRYPEFLEKTKEVAALHKLEKNDPVTVAEFLKRDQVVKPDEVRALYERTFEEMQKLIVERQLATPPSNPVRIRVLNDVESEQLRLPAYECQTRSNFQQGLESELLVPSSTTGKSLQEDVTFAATAAVWFAHEARPGHDLECLHKRESVGTSKFRDGNGEAAEGWALYSERMVYPYLTPDQQFAAFRLYLLRVARAFLDPEVNMGRIDEKAAKKLIVHELGFTEDWAKIEMQRYKFKMPAQAPSYFYGMARLLDIKDRVRAKLGGNLVERCFNDTLLDHSFLPLNMIEERMVELAEKNSVCPAAK